MKVRELMTKDVVCANPESTLEEIAAMMKTADTGAIPVVDGDELIGVITDRDIVIRCIAEGKDPLETTAEEISSEDIHTIEPDTDADEALHIMERHQVRRLPVVEDGRLLGVISIGDVAVKGNARKSGEALEGVSRGVKHDGEGRGRKAERGSGERNKKTAGSNEKRNDKVHDRQERLEHADGRSAQRRGGANAVRKGEAAQALPRRGDKPGISSHRRQEEDNRQARVIPFRDETQTGAKTGRKRKVS
jgi:CBS domain-containing protein